MTTGVRMTSSRERRPGASPLRVPCLVVHGGAGARPPSDEPDTRDGMLAAARAGWRVLADGGRSLEAVELAVRVLEDHPRFNAGRGSVLAEDGTVELDASIMEGDTLACGAVGAVTRIGNPVTLARRVLEDGRHILLVAEGAHAFARSVGVPECDPAWLVTDRQRERHVARRATSPSVAGTVGAVALDRHGTAAAATSTGGIAGKRRGRIGDSALIGCGTYADSTLGAVSCTGDGEAVIRVVLARRTLDFLKEADDPVYAAKVAIDLLVEEGRGQGGLVVVDWRGRMGWARSTATMPVAWMAPTLAEPAVEL